MDLLHTKAESPHAVEDLVSGLHPFEGCAAVVVGVDVRQDRRAQLRDARVRAAFQGFLRNLKKRSTRLSHEA